MDPSATWVDKQERPYDTPINDFELPVQQARLMKERQLGQFDLLVCSPFRRCLQTASLVAAELGIKTVLINTSMSERVSAVKKAQRDVWGDSRPADGVVTYLDDDQQQQYLGAEVSIEGQMGTVPPTTEDHHQTKCRYQKAFDELREEFCVAQGKSVLVVAHGGELTLC